MIEAGQIKAGECVVVQERLGQELRSPCTMTMSALPLEAAAAPLVSYVGEVPLPEVAAPIIIAVRHHQIPVDKPSTTPGITPIGLNLFRS
jgi:hypothetical protein